MLGKLSEKYVLKYPRMFPTASLVYLLIVTNFGIFSEVRLMFKLIKLGMLSDIVLRIMPAVNLVDKTTAVFCESSGKGYLGEEAICTKHDVKYICISFSVTNFQ